MTGTAGVTLRPLRALLTTSLLLLGAVIAAAPAAPRRADRCLAPSHLPSSR